MTMKDKDIALIAKISKTGMVDLEVLDHTVSARVIKKASGMIWKQLRRHRRGISRITIPPKFNKPTIREQEKGLEKQPGNVQTENQNQDSKASKTGTSGITTQSSDKKSAVSTKLAEALKKSSQQKTTTSSVSSENKAPAAGVDAVIEQS